MYLLLGKKSGEGLLPPVGAVQRRKLINTSAVARTSATVCEGVASRVSRFPFRVRRKICILLLHFNFLLGAARVALQ